MFLRINHHEKSIICNLVTNMPADIVKNISSPKRFAQIKGGKYIDNIQTAEKALIIPDN